MGTKIAIVNCEACLNYHDSGHKPKIMIKKTDRHLPIRIVYKIKDSL